MAKWQQGSSTTHTVTTVGPDGRVTTSPRFVGVFRDQFNTRHKRTFLSKSLCNAWLAEQTRKVRKGRYVPPPPDHTFRAFAATWLENRKPSLSPAAFRTYWSLLGLSGETGRRVPSPVEFLGDHRMSTLTPAHLVRFFVAVTGPEGLSAQSVVNVKTALSTLFSDAVALGALANHPLKSRLSRMPKAQRAARRLNKAPSLEVASRFVNWLQAHESVVYCYVLLLCGSSLRPGEATGLRVGQVDRAAGVLRIIEKYDPRAKQYGVPKSKQSTRAVDAPLAVLAAIDALLVARYGSVAAAPATALVLGEAFSSETLRKNRSGWNRMLRAAGVTTHFTAYALRHFFASAHLSRGRSVQWVSAQMGHSRVSTTWNSYADVVTTDRPGDSLVGELLAGSAPGTTSSGMPPTGSDLIGRDAAQVPTKSENTGV
jgi:integrase